MLIIPAIDLREGRVVRLRQGDYARETAYRRDPVETARRFVEQGAARVHVVDLDAARGRPDPASAAAMAAIVRAVTELGATTEVGGGMRSAGAVGHWLDVGAGHVVLGSVALRDPLTARSICSDFPERVLLALDVRGSDARAQGWTEPGGRADEHVRRWREWPAAGIIHTNTERDGMLEGPDLEAVIALRDVYGGAVYASGGIAALEHVGACRDAGVAGVIIGRAAYEGGVDIADAVRRFGAAAAA